MGELRNHLWLALAADGALVSQRQVRVRWLRQVIQECQRMSGVLTGTMRRDEALAFLQLGQQIERAELTCRLLAVRADSAVPGGAREPYDEVHRMALLRSLASYQPYRRAMPARPDAGSTLRFLLQDEAFPRAVSACVSEMRDLVKTLPRNESVLAACTDAAVVVAEAPVSELTSVGLRAFLDELQPAVGAVHDEIEATYFVVRAHHRRRRPRPLRWRGRRRSGGPRHGRLRGRCGPGHQGPACWSRICRAVSAACPNGSTW